MRRQTNVCGEAKEAPSVHVTREEMVEAELDRLITKRHNKRRVFEEGEQLAEEGGGGLT